MRIGMKVLNALRASGVQRIGCTDIFVSDDAKIAEIIERASGAAEMLEALRKIESAYTDMSVGWQYIQTRHGKLDGIGFERCEKSYLESMTIYDEIIQKYGAE